MDEIQEQYVDSPISEGQGENYYNYDNNAYYGGQYVEPLDATDLVQNNTEVDPNVINIVPGRDGVPYNITQKGIDNLTRLERLRRNGVISDNNFRIMREKVFSKFVVDQTTSGEFDLS